MREIGNATFKNFRMKFVGNDEKGEVFLSFQLWFPYTRDIWEFIGAMAGEEVWCSFEPVVPESEINGNQLTLTSESEEEEEEEYDDEDGEDEESDDED